MASALLNVGTRAMTTTLEAFLLIEQPRQRLGHWTSALASLDSPLAPTPSAVVAYYDPTCDQAMINLQYDEAMLGERKLEFVVNVALLAEVGMVQPAELSEGERVRFLATRLSRCTIRVTSQSTALGALTELAREIRRVRAPHSKTQIPASQLPRNPTPQPPMPVLPVVAKGTRDNLERYETNTYVDDSEVMSIGDSDVIILDDAKPRVEPVDISPGTSRYVIQRASRHATVEMPPETASMLATAAPAKESRKTSPMGVVQLDQLANTDWDDEDDARMIMPPLSASPSSSQPLPPILPDEAPAEARTRTRDRSPTVVGRRASQTVKRRPESEPYVPTGGAQNMIYARYLRGGRWLPVRVGALSLKGAALMTGALPRVDDRVDVALTFDTHRALVRGTVAKVSTPREAQATGAATFSVTFKLDLVSRQQLTSLLTAARNAKVTIKPPPARATRRFPVEWQIALESAKGPLQATALDVSSGGMFIRSPVAFELGDELTATVALDDGGAPVSARTKVVRRITEADARTCGLAAGYGLGIVDMPEAERMRWLGFLARIERRAEKRVLIGADPSRLAELQAGLASLGYAVSGGTDPGTLVQLASADARPADAVLIDSDWLHNDTSTSLVESLFSARNVPCVTMQGEVRRARQAIDRLLEVVV